jgi:hypothetical protein
MNQQITVVNRYTRRHRHVRALHYCNKTDTCQSNIYYIIYDIIIPCVTNIHYINIKLMAYNMIYNYRPRDLWWWWWVVKVMRELEWLRCSGSHEGGILLVEYCCEASDVVVLSMVVIYLPKLKEKPYTRKSKEIKWNTKISCILVLIYYRVYHVYVLVQYEYNFHPPS